MKSILLLCPINLIDKTKQYLNIFNNNNIKYCICINDLNIKNKLNYISNKTDNIKIKDLLSEGIELEYINTNNLDNEVPFYIFIERYIRYPYNYNLKNSEEIKRCIKDSNILGIKLQCLNKIIEIKNNREVIVTGTKTFYTSSISERDLEALKNNYLVNLFNEEILDPLGIISTKIISSSGDEGVEIGFSLGKIIENMKLLGYSYLDFS